MIFLHEIHEISGGRMPEFEDSYREGWKPLVERDGTARLLWFWQHTHGTGPSYQAVSITAVRDWAAWGEIVRRTRDEHDLRRWTASVCEVRREVTSKILVPTAWSPLQTVDLEPSGPSRREPALHLHDTGWPFPGRLEPYVEALGSVFYPAVKTSGMISVEACWTVAPGTGRFHEVVLLQKILDWTRFSELLTRGENPSRRIEWMSEGLKHRDRWESKLLRTAPWSPL
ncbi:MAG: NIPSNAP family protein [Candidatus Binatia bacterium]